MAPNLVRALAMCLVLLATPAPAAASAGAAAPEYREDWESGTDGWTATGGAMQVDCAATAGSPGCALRLHPWETYTAQEFRARTPIDVTLGGLTALTFRLRSDNAHHGDGTLSVRLDLGGASWLRYDAAMRLCCTAGFPARLASSDGATTPTFVHMPSAGVYYVFALFIDSDAGVAWAEALELDGRPLGRSESVALPQGAAAASAIEIIGVQNPGLVSAFHVDTIRLGAGDYRRADAPTNLTATAGARQIALDWDAPAWADEGLREYRVYARASGAESLVGVTSSPGFTHEGLANGERRTYRVAAVTVDGVISWSSNEATARTWRPASAPQALVAEAGDLHVQLSWTAPASDGGGPVLGYRLYRTVGGAPTLLLDFPAQARAYRDELVAPGPEHEYRLVALTAVGEGAPATAPAATGRADAPQNFTASATTEGVALAWDPPADEGLAPVLFYEITRTREHAPERDGAVFRTTQTSYLDVSAPAWRGFVYSVRAVNAIGPSPAATSERVVPTHTPRDDLLGVDLGLP